MFSQFCEYVNLEYVRMYAIYRVRQAEYGIRILCGCAQEYVNTYSTRRILTVSLSWFDSTLFKNRRARTALRERSSSTSIFEQRSLTGAQARSGLTLTLCDHQSQSNTYQKIVNR